MFGCPPGLPADWGDSSILCWLGRLGAVGFALIALGRALDPKEDS